MLKKLANFGLGTAKTAGKVGMGITGTVGKTAGYGGHRVLSSAMNNPGKTLAMVGGVAGAGYALADLDGRSDRMSVAGNAAMGAITASAIPGMTTAASLGATSLVGGAAGIGGATMMIGRNALKVPDQAISFSNMGDIKFSALGKGMLLGGAAIEGATKAINKYEQIRMGQNDGMMRRATPVIPQVDRNNPSYANNGGATGDLVFSMYNNR